MKLTKIRIELSDLRKTEEFENRRFSVAVEADLDESDDYEDAKNKLVERLKLDVDNFFEEDAASMKKKLARYRREYGEL